MHCDGIPFYTLSMSFKFTEKDDTVFIAMNLPYSYSKMLKKISDFK